MNAPGGVEFGWKDASSMTLIQLVEKATNDYEQAIRHCCERNALDKCSDVLNRNGWYKAGTCKWKPSNHVTDGEWYDTDCGEIFTWEPYGVPNYCPNCGREVEHG